MIANFILPALAPAILAVSAFVLVINRNDGTKITVPTDAITKMEFLEGGPLESPQPQATVSGTSATITWGTVENADSYTYKLDSQITIKTRGTSITFNGLAPGQHTFAIYAAPADEMRGVFSESNPATISFTVDQQTLPMNPGDKGTVFAPGVSTSGGFVDVDKVFNFTDASYGSDNLLCWACTTAGMLQWWLNDYRRVHGQDYPLAISLLDESPYYSTPVMDEFTRSYVDAGYLLPEALSWFAEGVDNPANVFLNGHCVYKPSYTNAKGGFMGMPKGKMANFYKEMNMWAAYGAGGLNLNEADFKVKLSQDLIDYLQKGVLGLCVASSTHAINCWGVDYEVNSAGQPIVTKLYVTENTDEPTRPNKHGSFEDRGEVTWGKNTYGSPRLYYMCDATSPYRVELSAYTFLSSWEYIDIDWNLPAGN